MGQAERQETFIKEDEMALLLGLSKAGLRRWLNRFIAAGMPAPFVALGDGRRFYWSRRRIDAWLQDLEEKPWDNVGAIKCMRECFGEPNKQNGD